MKNKVLLLDNSPNLGALLRQELSPSHELVCLKDAEELFDVVDNSSELQTVIINSELFSEPGPSVVAKLRSAIEDPIVSIVALANEISDE